MLNDSIADTLKTIFTALNFNQLSDMQINVSSERIKIAFTNKCEAYPVVSRFRVKSDLHYVFYTNNVCTLYRYYSLNALSRLVAAVFEDNTDILNNYRIWSLTR